MQEERQHQRMNLFLQNEELKWHALLLVVGKPESVRQ